MINFTIYLNIKENPWNSISFTRIKTKRVSKRRRILRNPESNTMDAGKLDTSREIINNNSYNSIYRE